MEDISFQFLLSACSTLNYPSPWNVFPRGVTKCNHWIAVWARLEHRSVCNKTHRQSSPQKSWTEKQLQNCLVCVAETVTIKLRTPIKWSLLIVSGKQQLWQTKIIRTTTCILQGEAHVLAGRGGQDRGGQGRGGQGRGVKEDFLSWRRQKFSSNQNEGLFPYSFKAHGVNLGLTSVVVLHLHLGKVTIPVVWFQLWERIFI